MAECLCTLSEQYIGKVFTQKRPRLVQRDKFAVKCSLAQTLNTKDFLRVCSGAAIVCSGHKGS